MGCSYSSQRSNDPKTSGAPRETACPSGSVQLNPKVPTVDKDIVGNLGIGSRNITRTDGASNRGTGSAGDGDGSCGVRNAVVGDLVDLADHKSETRSGDGHIIDILRAHGTAFYEQFRRTGTIEGINKALDCWSVALDLTPDSHVQRPEVLGSLGSAYEARFERLGKAADLNKAIVYRSQAVSLTPDGHPNIAVYLSELGSSYQTRFQRIGGLADLRKAIECGARAVSLTPDAHPNKPGILSNLGTSYKARFEYLGDPVDVNNAIECEVQALSLAPDGHGVKSRILHNLGTLYLGRFDQLGELADLHKSIECGVQATSITPNGHPDKPGTLSNLGLAYRARSLHLGKLVDLDTAIECAAQAVSLTPDGHPDQPSRLSNLGNSCLARFERLGELVDLNKAIECGARAASLMPDGYADERFVLDNLGLAYQSRFRRLGELADLNRAIECGARAVMLTPDSHTAKPDFLVNLTNSYIIRFSRLGELTDLNDSIEYGAKAVLLATGSHTGRPAALNSLGSAFKFRFDGFGNLEDLDKSIKCAVQMVLLTPDGHADKPAFLNNLSVSYQSRFDHLGQIGDLNKCIEFGTQAASLLPDGHPTKLFFLSNLGLTYRIRFERFGELEDLGKSIEYKARSVSLTPDGHPIKPVFIAGLGDSYAIRFDHSHELSDLELAVGCFKASAQSFAGAPHDRFKACRRWAHLASQRPEIFSPRPAYQQAIELLPQLIWIGTTIDRRYSVIAEFGDFATEAAAYAIGAGAHELALEWLEVGRSIIWGQISQLRTPFDQLSDHDPTLASRLTEISFELDHAASRSSSAPPLDDDEPLDFVASRHIQLALEWDKCLNKARSIPGFEDFLQPPKLSQLLSSAKSYPIAVINVHKSRCDALILRPNSIGVLHVPLTEFSAANASIARGHLALLVGHRGFIRVHKPSVGSLEMLLGYLWLGVVKPVLDSLGFTRKLPTDQLPRIAWCTTGMLSFLPLHAAGCYDQPQPKTFDLVISSFTPTISALLVNRPAIPSTHQGILAVGQEYTHGFEDLPCVKDELRIIQHHAQSISYLQLENHKATIKQVLDAMEKFSWVHLACHGTQHPVDPTQSAFHLHDGSLTLAEITKRSFRNKGLAFLSACQTAAGDEGLPEEAVHLAAGMLIAGFPSVIGTMWSIVDEDGPEVVDKVYTKLMEDGMMDHTKGAVALHDAVAHLRAKVGEKAITRWAPFIHIGI